MKRTIFFLILILCISCKKNEVLHSNNLKKRVILLESYDSSGSFLSDSIIEFYKNKLIIEKKHFLKVDKESSYVLFYQNFEYNEEKLLTKVNTYNDVDLNDISSTTEYSYNGENNIQKIEYKKIRPSNLSDDLYNSKYDYEYISDTIKVYFETNKFNSLTTREEAYVVYGKIDSIFSKDSNTMTLFNEYNDPYRTKYLGAPNDTFFSYQTDVLYGENRQAIMSNSLGSKVNMFLIKDKPFRFYNFELSNNYTKEYFYKGNRADNFTKFNYIFDENNRLLEVETSGTIAGNAIIKYYYE